MQSKTVKCTVSNGGELDGCNYTVDFGRHFRRVERPPAHICTEGAILGGPEGQGHRQMKGFIIGVLVTVALVALAVWGYMVLTQVRM